LSWAEFGDTTAFDHPSFTEQDLPAIRTHLALAVAQLDRAVDVSGRSTNGNMKALLSRLRGLRDAASQLLNTIDRRV